MSTIAQLRSLVSSSESDIKWRQPRGDEVNMAWHHSRVDDAIKHLHKRYGLKGLSAQTQDKGKVVVNWRPQRGYRTPGRSKQVMAGVEKHLSKYSYRKVHSQDVPHQGTYVVFHSANVE